MSFGMALMGIGMVPSFMRRAGGGGTPALFGFTLYNQAASSTITDFPSLRVRINGGAWQTLSAAGLTISQPVAGVLDVDGFAGTESSVEFHIEHEQPGEPFNTQGSISGIYAKATTGDALALAGMAGIPLAATFFDEPVGATA